LVGWLVVSYFVCASSKEMQANWKYGLISVGCCVITKYIWKI